MATPLFAVNVALVVDGVTTAAAVIDPMAGELYWTDGNEAFVRREDAERALVPHSSSGLVEVNCDGPLDTPFVGGNLVADPALRAQFGPRVVSSTLGVVWAADARRAAYVSDGSLLVSADAETHQKLLALVAPHLRAAEVRGRVRKQGS